MPFIPSTANAADVQALREALERTPVGEVCTYDALSAALGSPIAARRYLLLRAFAMMNRDSGAIFGVVRKVGYKRLAPADAHTLGSTSRARIRHTARNTSARIAQAINLGNDVPPEAARRAAAEVATLNMIAHLSSERVVKAQEADGQPPTLAEGLRGVLKHMGVQP